MSEFTKKFQKFFKKEENAEEVAAKVVTKGKSIFSRTLITKDMELSDLRERESELIQKREDCLMNHGKFIADNTNYLQTYYGLTEEILDIREEIRNVEDTIKVLKEGLDFLNS